MTVQDPKGGTMRRNVWRAMIGALSIVLAIVSSATRAAGPSPTSDRTDLGHSTPVTTASSNDAPESAAGPAASQRHPARFYIQQALARNPTIQAARRDVAAIRATIPQVTALEDPQLSGTFWFIPDNSTQTAAGRMPAMATLSQKIPWLAKLDTRGDIAAQQAKMALARLAGAELSVIEQIRLAYFDLYYNQRAVEITRDNQALLEKIVRFATIRYQSGGSQQDVLNVQLEQNQLQKRLIQYETALRQSQAELAALMHAPPGATPLAKDSLDLPPVPDSLDHLDDLAARHRPELRERSHAIQREKQRRELARLQYYPDVTVGLVWGSITANNALSPIATGNDNFGLNLGVNLPVYRDRIRAGVHEAEHRVVQSARQYEAALDDTRKQIRQQWLAADSARRQLALYEENIVPRAERALDISISDYSAGKTDILQVVSNYAALLEFRLQIARLQADLGQALASLDRVVGCQIARLSPSANPVGPPPKPAPPAVNGPTLNPANYEMIETD